MCLWLTLAHQTLSLASNGPLRVRRVSVPNKIPKRLRRSESFFGLHFDLHARDTDDRIGENVTRKMVENIIEKVKPDYIQCDCKGHPGISSYPTKVGNPAPGFVRDPLRIWRDVTARRGVALYMHYSGVWDSAAVKHNPEWARVDENGNVDWRLTSVFAPYVDKLLIPQLKELRDNYDVDGVWVDGECWAVAHDYSKATSQAFQKKIGIKELPRKATDPRYSQFTELCRQGFRRYFKHYVTELHKHDLEFQICSNWAYSSFMPEPVTVDVDFLSGDFSPNDGINSARFEARCLRGQGKPWDLMSWSFYRTPDATHSTKSALQLQQEAAVVLALGGGYQAYFKQKRDCSIYDWQVNIMSELAKFCRARQKYCHRAEPVPQIALIYSGKAIYRGSTKLFGSWGDLTLPFKGVLNGLLNSQYSVEVLMEHHLAGRMHEYPLIILPEWDYLPEDFRSELIAYVKKGGNLLIIGPKAAALFKEHLGVTFEGKPEEKSQWLECNGHLAGFRALVQSAKPGTKAKMFGKLFSANEVNDDFQPAASITTFGKGRIAATYFDFGWRYYNAGTAVFRDFLNTLVRQLFPAPVVEIAGSHYIDVTVNRIEGKLAVNLVNTSGPHADKNIYVFDDVPQVGPLRVKIRSNKKPQKVTIEPAGRAIAYEYADGKVEFTLPYLEIHDLIIVD